MLKKCVFGPTTLCTRLQKKKAPIHRLVDVLVICNNEQPYLDIGN